ncbi:MAG: radical SAM protein [Myxococcales bacterium]|nr:radical SAM protein [Myxococcales bacterium]
MTAARDRPRVLLLWPGGLFGGGANFGVPQLLSIAGVLERQGDAIVDIVDLDMERAFGPIDLKALLAPGYDLIGVSCYSSYDYLKVMAIGEELRRRGPRAWLVAGGYHASARPGELTGEGSPFDYVVIGDGEAPMLRLVQALSAGNKPLQRQLGPESLADPSLAHYDWERLDRYRPIARSVASQAEIYLSRGCPFDCAFCMERAKRDVSWRPLEAERAVEEIHRLDDFLDLSRWTLFVADALFGMKTTWRRAFLEGLARRPSRARKIWLLIRVDLIEREDLELMARANVSPGFGLESGDPAHLKRIRKAGRLDDYLDRMMAVARWARELDVPFGANVIVGHPGETEASLRTSARYLRELFLGDRRGTTGFLSVDPFRLYPGSPIDEELDQWRADTGMRVHRYPWWHDGDQAFLSEWVDPSAELDFRTTLRLRRELFDPILHGIGERFVYQGPARDYYRRAIDEQIALTSPRQYLHTLGMWHLWQGLVGGDDAQHPITGRPITSPEDDPDLPAIAQQARAATLDRLGLASGHPALAAALREVPRERFVSREDIADSARDQAFALSADGGSTISAFHAYVAAFEALELGPGDALVDLGGGTGYGAALASRLVGPEGDVLSLELEPEVAARAAEILADFPPCRAICADAHDTTHWSGASKIYVAFALPTLPERFHEAMAEGARLVAPIGEGARQTLTLFHKTAEGLASRALGEVRYVPDRHPAALSSP